MSGDRSAVQRGLRRSALGRRAHGRVVSGLELLRGVERLDRLRWLYRPAGRVPDGAFHFRSVRPPSEADVALCERLIRAYVHAVEDAPDQTGMWSEPVFRERQGDLLRALERRDPRTLAATLAGMFRSDIVVGMAAGSMGAGGGSRLWHRLLWLSTLSRITSLAESRGAVRTENPEQGAVAAALDAGLESVVEATEDAIGASLDFPEVGANYGVLVGGRLISPDAPDQVYAAARIADAMELHLSEGGDTPRLVEIGGGYGGMAYWLMQMRPTDYTIVDLPQVGVLQGYFLGRALGPDAIRLYGEDAAEGASVTLLPDHALGSVAGPVDVVANKDSLPEIDRDAAVGYLEWARANCTGLFYSYNHESAAEFAGVAQNVLGETLEDTGGFTRIRRDPSWVRRGYVEEIFLPTAA